MGNQYTKAARSFGLMLAVAHDNDRERELMLERVRRAIAEFRKENSLFNARFFAATVAQIAFPGDERQHPAVIADLLNENC